MSGINTVEEVGKNRQSIVNLKERLAAANRRVELLSNSVDELKGKITILEHKADGASKRKDVIDRRAKHILAMSDETAKRLEEVLEVPC